ncbi:MAG: radical SAM protein [Verrucomicrobiae bacterium]|nr:radical SAM protein [Verrucomicrobiae bacterium]
MNNHVTIRLHRFLPVSFSNGPGARFVVWVQGCSLNCPGCFNPDTHSFDGGDVVEVDDLFSRVLNLNKSIEGITISGGEPLEQANSLAEFVEMVKTRTQLSVIILTGFEWEEIMKLIQNNYIEGEIFKNLNKNLVGVKKLLEFTDVIIAGRYEHNLRISRQLRGSSNKTIHYLTNRYSPQEFDNLPDAEIIIDSSGRLTITGIKPPFIM